MKKWYNSLGFTKKDDLVCAIRKIVSLSILNTPIPTDDFKFMLSIFKRHAQFMDKIGCGLKHIEVRNNKGVWGCQRGFWLIRSDLSETDISWVVAITPEGKTSETSNFIATMRHEIMNQVEDFKLKNNSVCGICAKSIDGKYEVDHVTPFKVILDNFISIYGIGETADAGLHRELVCPDYRLNWQNYHFKIAKLQPLHQSCHKNKTFNTRR